MNNNAIADSLNSIWRPVIISNKWIQRRWKHVTRKRAVSAWVLTGFSVLIYALTPHLIRNESAHEPVRQFLLIVAGVAAGAIFLPELTENLWSLKRDEVRQIIPNDKRKNLSRVLIAAASDDEEWNDLVFEHALSPLLMASVNPHQYVKNMRYSVQVHVNKMRDLDAQRLHYHHIETQSHSERVLPPPDHEGMYTVSIAATQGALLSEFSNPACLARELVQLDYEDGMPVEGDAWQQAVTELCTVSIALNGVFLQGEPVERGTNLLRWKFSAHDLPNSGDRLPVFIKVDFPVRVTEERFPVYFSGFYCAGSTVASMKVFGLPEDAELRCDAFFARGLMERAPENEDTTVNLLYKEKSFTTGSNSILWPGSGVVFDWHQCRGLSQ